jgi:hypothetical protein
MRKTTILVILVLMLGNFNNTAAAQGLLTRLIEIKYTAELYLSSAIKQVGSKNDGKDGEGSVGANAKDTALAIYNTLRWKVDGLVYQLSGDMVAANSPRKMRLLNEWCLQQPKALILAKTNESNKNKSIQTYTLALKEIYAIYRTQIANPIYAQTKTKNINLTTNVFYLLKDSYTIIKGLSDMKTQKTMALIELLDHTRLLSPGEIGKMGK